MKSLLAVAAFACLANLPLAQAQAPCPDTRATQVAAKIDGSGGTNQCVIGITLFGITFGISVGDCPLYQTVTPAHQECQGAYNEGTQCAAGEDMEVSLLKCECNFLGGRTFGLGLPGCDCTDAGNAGTVEDAKTVDCITPRTNATD